MSRHNETKGGTPNPATRFLEWASTEKAFRFWNKEEEKEEFIAPPMRLLFLKQMHTVKGWDDKSESRIYANEVEAIGKEPLVVKSWKGGVLSEGLWKDIKSRVNTIGGVYYRSIYVMTESGEIWNISLKGAAVADWYQFYSDNKADITYNWFTISSSETRTKGKVKYNVPVFELDNVVDKKASSKADEVYATLKMYIDAYKEGDKLAERVEKEVAVAETEEDDDLPF